MSVPYRLFVNQGYGASSGNMIDALSGARQEERSWIMVEERDEGVFTVVGHNFTGSNTEISFRAWDDEVSDLDGQSDAAQCFGMSNHLRWNDVHMEPRCFHAPSLRMLEEALKHVTFCAFDPGDI